MCLIKRLYVLQNDRQPGNIIINMSAKSSIRTALIVDDEMTNRLILRSLLKKQGYHTIEAENGQQAIDMYLADKPNIIFMDVMMPEMDGYEATRFIKNHAGNFFIPIIFLTAMTDEKSLQTCIDAGGDDFLTKPYDKFLLQNKIRAMERIADLNRDLQGMYSLIHREQEIAEQVFINAVQNGNIETSCIRQAIRPAGTFSGDMILTESSPTRDIHILLGDFTGHGLSAALGAMPVSEVFRAMTTKGFTLEEILIGINKKLRQFLPTGMFLGAHLISISHNLDKISVFNAGMPPLLIIDGKTHQIKFHVKSRGLPLGILNNVDTREMIQTFPLTENDRLILYSDGLTEAWSEADEEFGYERLEQAIQSAQENQFFDNILASLDTFCGSRTQVDDVTLIEVNCVEDLLPALTVHHDIPRKPHHFDSIGDWEYVFTLKDKRLSETNPVPIIINQIMELEGIEDERQSLFTVLTELYVNALDHGILRLPSSLKSDPAGFAQYFRERELRLNVLNNGYVLFHITVEQNDGYRSIQIRIEDSGPGFDFTLHKNNPHNHLSLSGRGILLVRDLCESLEYIGNGNIAQAVYSWKSN
jgi:two-component system, HptB-dependent secretion and biofilm response regulator